MEVRCVRNGCMLTACCRDEISGLQNILDYGPYIIDSRIQAILSVNYYSVIYGKVGIVEVVPTPG